MGKLPIDRSFVVEVLKELVATNSVNPDVGKGPGESALSNLLFDRLTSITPLDVLKQPVANERSNVIAILRGTGEGRSLMLNGHMDTVGVEGMVIEPFRPFVESGLLHGRGACDMKGAIAAMIGAAKSLADSKSKLRGDVIFSFVVDEEHLSIGIERLVEEYKADAAIVGNQPTWQSPQPTRAFFGSKSSSKEKLLMGLFLRKELTPLSTRPVSCLDSVGYKIHS